MGLDLDSDEKSRAKKLLYVPDVVDLEQGRSSAELDRAGGGRRRRPADHHARRLPGPEVDHAVRHVRAPADLHLQRRRPGGVPRRVRPAGRGCCRRTG